MQGKRDADSSPSGAIDITNMTATDLLLFSLERGKPVSELLAF